MNRFFAALALTVVAVLGLAVEGQARGCRSSSSSCCSVSCCDTCAPCAAPVVAPAPQFTEQKVTCYKPVMVEKVIDVVVCKTVMKDVPFTYSVCVPVMKPEVRKVTTCISVPKEVEFTYTVMIPSTVSKVVKVTTYECKTEMVTEMRQVCKLVPVTCTDACGCCYTRCERVMVDVPCTRCVVTRIPIVKDVTVNEIVCTPEVRKGKKTVCELVTQVKDVTVNVCTYVTEQRQGVKKVCELVKEMTKQKVQVCTMVPYETTVRVPVCTTCSTSSCCDSVCGYAYHGHRRCH
jgi:hypothetical protein